MLRSAVLGYLEKGEPAELVGFFQKAMRESGLIRKECHQIAHSAGRAALAKIGTLAGIFELDR